MTAIDLHFPDGGVNKLTFILAVLAQSQRGGGQTHLSTK